MTVYYNGRLTTEETAVYWRYGEDGGYADGDHIQFVTIPAAMSAGEFRLRVNGYETDAIDSQAGTPETAIDTALDNVVDADGVAVFDGSIAVADEGSGVYSITFSSAWANYPMVVEVFQVGGDTAWVGGSVTTSIDEQGGGNVEITGGLMNVNTGLNQETVDVTAMGETTRNESTTVQQGSFDMKIFHASQDYLVLLRAGATGVLTVYERGVGPGLPYFSFQVLVKQADVGREAFDKIEISLSGTQQGAPISPFGSFQPPS